MRINITYRSLWLIKIFQPALKNHSSILRFSIIETLRNGIPVSSRIPAISSIFLATTRSCESTSRRKSTARSPSRAIVHPLSPFYPFSSRRFISSGGARFRAHKSPRARNRKHPPSSTFLRVPLPLLALRLLRGSRSFPLPPPLVPRPRVPLFSPRGY